MSNPFQEQLLKAGMVSKKQVQKANKDNYKKKKQQGSKKSDSVDKVKLAAQQAAREKAELDRALNRKKEDAARQKALASEIDQIIMKNSIARDDECDIAYNFEHNKKINRIYISKEMQQQLARGALGIAGIEARYELVARAVAEKILLRDASRVILFDSAEQGTDVDDEYAEYQVPDDLTW